jgi:hypothetical protein
MSVFTQAAAQLRRTVLEFAGWRTNRVHYRLPPDARTSTVALTARGSAAVILLFPRCYFAVSTAMPSMKK